MSRFTALFLVILASLVSPAFSADPQPGTTTTVQIVPRDDDIDPVTGLARSSVVRPLVDVAPVADPRRIPTTQARPHVALILPMTSPALGRLADAVRQGFMAGAAAGGKETVPVMVTGIDSEGPALLEACRTAQAAGAQLVVAALTRDAANLLVGSDCARQPVLALNEPQAPANEIPVNLYTFSLSLESEARQAALLAVAEGGHSAVIVTSGSPLARRVQEAFEKEWTRAAGQIAGRLTFTGTAEDAPLVRERMASAKADMVFMALDPPEARIVRPYISGMLPLYATSLSINPRAEAIVNLDLQGMRYVEMPWFVQPDHPAVMVYPVPKSMSVDEERLYAFGIDAYRISQQLLHGDKRAPIDGVTGKLTLEPPTHFARTLTPAEVDGGRVIPLRQP